MRAIDYNEWLKDNTYFILRTLQKDLTVIIVANCKCHGTPYTAASHNEIAAIKIIRRKYQKDHSK